LQCAGVSYSLENGGLTEADRLNGYEWRGRTLLVTTAVRRTVFDPDARDHQENSRRWGPWANTAGGTLMSFTLSKKNGHWYYGDGK